jgi:hypothetical protein
MSPTTNPYREALEIARRYGMLREPEPNPNPYREAIKIVREAETRSRPADSEESR